MKRLSLIAIATLFACSAFAQLEVGKKSLSAAGSVQILPSDFAGNTILFAQAGYFVTDAIEVIGGLNLNKFKDVDLGLGAVAGGYYHIPFAAKTIGFAGVLANLPILPDFSWNIGINTGVDYFLSESVALRIYNSYVIPDEGDATDYILIGVVSYF